MFLGKEKIVAENLLSKSSSFFARPALCGLMSLLILGACSQFPSDEKPNHSWFKGEVYGTEGDSDAQLATVAYSQGKFDEAENYVIQALRLNPRHPQALMVGALVYEKLGRLNRARQYYEDLIIIGENESTVLGSPDGMPQKMSDIAKTRLRRLNMQQSEFMIENKDGAMTFNISKEAAARQGKSAMEEALFARQQKLVADNQASADADIKAVELLFDDNEKNVISRFLIMQELAEKDMITKQEFLEARQSNIGGLLPLSNKAPAFGINAPVPSPDLIIERINALREAMEARAITPKEFSAERDLIITAILPPEPRLRMQPKAPSKDIMSAAKDLRKLEVISELGLITKNEKAKEKKAIEEGLGLNNIPKNSSVEEKKSDVKKDEKPNQTAEKVESVAIETTATDNQPQSLIPSETESLGGTVEEVQIIVPDVSNPFVR